MEQEKPLRRQWLLFLTVSGVITIAAMLAAVLFFRNLGNIVVFCGSSFGLSEDMAVYAADVLGVLQRADIRPPFLFLGIAFLIGCGFQTQIKRRRYRWAAAMIYLVMVTLLTIWLTRVNSIRFGNVAASLLSLLAAGAF